MYILVETNKTTGRKLVVALFSFSETIYIYMYIYIYKEETFLKITLVII